MPRRAYSPLEKQRLYEKFRKSDLKLSDFALKHGVSKSAFGKWVREIENQQTFLSEHQIDNILKPILSQPVSEEKPVEQLANDKIYIEFIMPNNIIIKLPIGKDIQLLVEILQAIII